MKAIGKKIKGTVGVGNSKRMEHHMPGNGQKIFSTVMVLNPGRMEPITKENINMGSRKDRESSTGQTAVSSWDSLTTIK